MDLSGPSIDVKLKEEIEKKPHSSSVEIYASH